MNELLQGNDGLMNRITELTGMNLEDRVTIPGQPSPSMDIPPNKKTVEPQGSVAPEHTIETSTPEELDVSNQPPPALDIPETVSDDSGRTEKPPSHPGGFSITTWMIWSEPRGL